MTLLHHTGDVPSVWDTPWPWTGLALLAFAAAAVPVMLAAFPARPDPGQARPVVAYRRVDAPPTLRQRMASPAFQPVGRHRTGWPARDARQLLASTGQYTVEDLADALYGVELQLVAGGAR